MMSQPGLQTAICKLQYTYCPISQSKGNQKTKFGQLIEYSKKNYAKNGARRLVTDLFYFSKDLNTR